MTAVPAPRSKRTSADQEREDGNFLSNLVIAAVGPLTATAVVGNRFLSSLNRLWLQLEREACFTCNLVTSTCTCLFLALVFISWLPVMDLVETTEIYQC